MAQQFNSTYGVEYFPQCEWLLTEVPKIRSLRDPQFKMSKSDTAEKSRINLDDDEDTIRLRIKQAVTDFTGQVSQSERRNIFANTSMVYSCIDQFNKQPL